MSEKDSNCGELKSEDGLGGGELEHEPSEDLSSSSCDMMYEPRVYTWITTMHC